MKNIYIIRRQLILNGEVYMSTYLKDYYVNFNGDKILQVKYEPDNRTIKKIFLMKQETVIGGYKRIESNGTHHMVNRLVYSAWGPELLSPYLVIDHIDCNPSNNNANNLRQVTQKENIGFSVANGNFGRGHCKAIMVYDKLTGTSKKYDSVREFLVDINAPEYMIKHNSLSSIRKRKEYNRYEYIMIQKS